jgi:predicted Fe-Mo cluster-binding NifX family protein
MKIAIPSKEQDGAHVVDAHFGHCQFFTILTVDDETREIMVEEHLVPPPTCGCKSNLATTLAQDGVTVLLAGNMGQGAVDTLGRAGIKALRGYEGQVRHVAEGWLAGETVPASPICDHHGHDDGACGHHH